MMGEDRKLGNQVAWSPMTNHSELTVKCCLRDGLHGIKRATCIRSGRTKSVSEAEGFESSQDRNSKKFIWIMANASGLAVGPVVLEYDRWRIALATRSYIIHSCTL